MLSSNQVGRLRELWATSIDKNCLDDLTIGEAEVKLPSSNVSSSSSYVTAGRLRDPAFILGRPYDHAVLEGIGNWEVHAPDRRLASVGNARVIGTTAVVSGEGLLYNPDPVSSGGEVLRAERRNADGRDGYALVKKGTGYHALFAQRALPRPYQMGAVFFHNVEPVNYGSFFFRQLPQMVFAAEQFPEDVRCYIVGNRTPWFFEALELLKLPILPVFTVSEVVGDTFAAIHICNNFDAEAFLQPGTNRGLKRLVDEVGTNDAPERIYVSRALSGAMRRQYRHMTNELAVEELVIKRGYEVVYPESLTFRRQIQKFGRARYIVGPSGSGMFNSAFAPRGAKILDIETVHNTVRQHAKFYSSQEHDYGFLFANIDPDDRSHPILRRSTVPTNLLTEAIDRIEGLSNLRGRQSGLPSPDSPVEGAVACFVESFKIDRQGAGYFGDEMRLAGWLSLSNRIERLELVFKERNAVNYEIGFEEKDQNFSPVQLTRTMTSTHIYYFRLDEKLPPMIPDLAEATLRVSLQSGNVVEVKLDTPEDNAPKRDGQSDSDLVMRFESCGNMCEFGLLQRKIGTERIGLLRYAGMGNVFALADAIAARFINFAERHALEIYEANGEWMSRVSPQHLSLHTGRLVQHISKERILAQERVKLQFMAGKFIQDIEEGKKIFVHRVHRSSDCNPDGTLGMEQLYNAMSSIGPVRLLWVNEASDLHQPGSVYQVHDGLYRGYVTRLAPDMNAFDFDVEGWLALLASAAALMGA